MSDAWRACTVPSIVSSRIYLARLVTVSGMTSVADRLTADPVLLQRIDLPYHSISIETYTVTY